MVNWEKVKYFYYVGTTLSFTRTAEILNTSQPVISKHIKDLENSLKTILFLRNKKNISLTVHGASLLNSVISAYENLSVFDNYGTKTNDDVIGNLNLKISLGISSSLLFKHILDFADLHANIRFNILENQSYSKVEGNEAHISSSILGQNGLIQRHFATIDMGFFASPIYLEKFGEPKSIDDLKKHRLLTSEKGIISLDTTKSNNWIPYLKMSSEAGLIHFAKEGLGIVELPCNIEGIKNNNLIQILLNIKPLKLKLRYTYLQQYKNNKRITAFGDYLVESFK